MQHEERTQLINLLTAMLEDENIINEQWVLVLPLLKQVNEIVPQGFEGTVAMFNNHFNRVAELKASKIKQFEIESGLIKLKMYFKRLDALAGDLC